MNKAEIDAGIAIIGSIIELVEKIDPNAAQNRIVLDLQKLIAMLQGVGL